MAKNNTTGKILNTAKKIMALGKYVESGNAVEANKENNYWLKVMSVYIGRRKREAFLSIDYFFENSPRTCLSIELKNDDFLMVKNLIGKNSFETVHNLDRAIPTNIAVFEDLSDEYGFEKYMSVYLDENDMDAGINLYYEMISVLGRSKGSDQECEGKRRIGHAKFRKDLLKKWDKKCCLTGCSNLSLITASHIVSWEDSNEKEKTDEDNGLPLVGSLDLAFDKHLISFSDDGKVLISRTISKDDMTVLGLNRHSQIINLNRLDKSKKYLKRHRAKFNKMNKVG